MNEDNDKKLNIIADLLKIHGEGLTITDVMHKTGFARHTVLTRLFFLMGSGNVSMRRINMAKLHYWIGEKEKESENVKMISLEEKHIKKVLVSPVATGTKEVVSHVSDKEKELEKRERELELREQELEKSIKEKELEKKERELELREKELVNAEETKEKVEEKVEKVEEKAEKEVEKVEEKVEKVVEKIDKIEEKAEKTKEKVEKVEEKTEAKTEKVEEKVEELASSVEKVKYEIKGAPVAKKKEKLDMVAIKKYIRGNAPLSSIQGVKEPIVKKSVDKESEKAPLAAVKKSEPVSGKLNMENVKEELRTHVKTGKLNKSQAQVLEQRAPISHVVEGTAHPEKKDRKTAAKKKKEFLLTGVPGFDGLFEDTKGIPKGAAVLVAGGAGSGKTLLCLQTMINRANLGEKCLFMSFEESEERLIEHMEMFGWNPKELIEKGTLLLKRFNPYEITRSVDALLMKAKGELLIEVDPIVFPEGFEPDIIVVDSLTAIASAFTAKEDSYRIYIEQLFRFFEELGSTAFLITETKQIPTVYSTTGVEEFLADGVIVIYNFKRGNTRENALEVLKMRGVKHQKKIVAMRINDNGITVYPDQEVYGGIEDK